MKQTINNSQFHDAFHKMGRGSQFSYEALNLIFNYFEQLEQDTKEEIELDVIAICCEVAESSIEQIIRDYSIDCDDVDEDEIEDHVLDYLDDETTVIGVTNNGDIVYVQF